MMWIYACLIFLIPGCVWLIWFPGEPQDAGERLAEAVGMSLALIAVLALAFFAFHISLNGVSLSLLWGGLTLAGLLRLVARLRSGSQTQQPNKVLPWAVAAIGMAGLIAWRLYQARTLVLPAWVDSLHHVLIVRKILESGALPASLEPYLPVPFYYHFAFHAAAAFFAYASQLSAEQAVLIFGQVLNAAVCLSVYRLGKALWQDPRRAGAAALLVGFFTTMPAYYLTWGRYTLLSGLVLLPLAMADLYELSRSTWDANGRSKRAQMLRLALLTAGVGLAHYLTALLLVFFAVTIGLVRIGENLQRRQFDLRGWLALAAPPFCGVLLGLPWFMRVLQYGVSSVHVSTSISPETTAQLLSNEYARYLWYLAGPQHNYWLLPLAAIGILLALRPQRGLAFSLWALWVLLECLPVGFHLNPFRPDHFVIVAFLPLALLSAHTLVSAGEAIEKVTHQPLVSVLSVSLTLLLLSIWGYQETRNILNPSTILATQDDLPALRWIQDNTPQNARFFINTTGWQGNVYRGVDGGAWILTLTGRWVLQPPPIFGQGDAAYVAQVNTWARQASQITTCDAAFWKVVDATKVNYIYLKAKVGSLQAAGLNGCRGIQPIYHHAGIDLYQIQRP